MRRLPSFLILGAMVVIAGSAAVVLNIQFGNSPGQAALLGVSLLVAMIFVRQHLERRSDVARLEARLAEIAAVAGDGQGEIGRLANRIAKFEQAMPGRIREETEPLSAEVEVVGQLLKQLAETLADIERRLEREIEASSRPAARAASVTGPGEGAAPGGVTGSAVANSGGGTRRSPRPAADDDGGLFVSDRPAPPPTLVRDIEEAVRRDAIEIHLQPIVTLPQRKVRYYEVLTRLKGSAGLIEGADFVPVAEERKLIARIDTQVVIRAFQVLKRLVQRNGDVGLFVNLSMESLTSSVFFRDFQTFLNQNRAMADLVQFELRQEVLRDLGPLETESLKAIADTGFRLSVDNVFDLGVDFRALADLGFRTAKLSAERLLGRDRVTVGDIHLADLSGHLQRQGITLVVDRVEQESQVVDLLDYDVHFAQGFLFSAPRQVRPEILAQTAPAGRREAVAGRR